MKSLFEEIKEIVRQNINIENYEIVPCGNHELKRNLVFKISHEHENYIIKVFFNKNKCIRELHSIPLVQEINPLRIIANGETNSGYEWILYNYLEGWLLDNIIDDLDLDQKRNLFYQIGKKTAEFHALVEVDYFGDWLNDKQSAVEKYRDFIITDCERMIENIRCQDLEQFEVLNQAVEILRSQYSEIRSLKIGRLCHRDLDGRNILVRINAKEGIQLSAFLDFEKCVVFNEYFDIIGFYRRYFMDQPKLIPYFFSGYEEILPIDESFNKELRFNLFRTGIDICSWSKLVSEAFYLNTIDYLKKLIAVNSDIESIYYKPKGNSQ